MSENDWILINLPWKMPIDYPDYPEYPSELVDNIQREQFGCTEPEFCKTFQKNWGAPAWELELRFEDNITSNCDDMPIEEIDRLMAESNDPIMVACKGFHKQLKQMESFRYSLPEVIAYNKRCNELEAASCFAYHPLNRPGVIIEVQQDDKTKRYLIGNINKHAGVCDDCTAFDNSAIILRAKVLISEEALQKVIEYGQ